MSNTPKLRLVGLDGTKKAYLAMGGTTKTPSWRAGGTTKVVGGPAGGSTKALKLQAGPPKASIAHSDMTAATFHSDEGAWSMELRYESITSVLV